jgi:hypothetical protein
MSSVVSGSGKRFAVAVGWLLHFHDDDVLLHVKVAVNCMWRWHMLPRWGGPLPFPERLQLASRSSASDCDHMCNPSSFVSSFWLVMAWGCEISCALQLQCFRIFVLLLPSVVRRSTAAVVQTWQSRCILDREFLLRVLRRLDLSHMCSNPFQPVRHCLKSAHDSLTGFLNSYQFRCDMDSSISNNAP